MNADLDGNMSVYFILDSGGEVTSATYAQWKAWQHIAEKERVVERTLISESLHVWVSTVFLGIGRNVNGKGQPLVYETKIFSGHLSVERWRYATRAEAVAGHARAVKLAKLPAAVEDQP